MNSGIINKFMADPIFAPVSAPAMPGVPSVESPIESVLANVIASGKPAKLTLAQAAAAEQNSGQYLAGSDMRVDEKIVAWAEQEIAAGRTPTFAASVATDEAEFRKTGPQSRSQGTRGYFVCNYTANFGQPFPFKALKPRGTIVTGQVVQVTVSKSDAGWNYSIVA